MNLLHDLPTKLGAEGILPLLTRDGVRIERIVSTGHASPDGFWYDQDEEEWVLILCGWGVVEFEDGRCVELRPGDYLEIPAHVRHRVQATNPAEPTVWLAIFYR